MKVRVSVFVIFLSLFPLFLRPLWGKLDPKTAAEINQYKLAILADPTNAMYHNLLAYTYEDNDMFMEALMEYQTAVKLEPDNPVYQNNLGMLYLRLGNPIKAVEHLKIAVGLSPDEPNFLVNYARALADDGKFKKAFRYLIAAYKKDKTFPEIKAVQKEIILKMKNHIELITKAYLDDKKFQEAQDELEKMLKFAQKIKLKGLASLVQKKIKLVKAALKKAIQEELARKLEEKKKEEQKVWRVAYLIIGSAGALILLGLIYLFYNTPKRKIKRAFKRGKYEIVIAEFEKNPALKKDVSIVKIYYEALRESNFYHKKIGALNILLQSDPKNLDYYLDLFELHFLAKSKVNQILSDLAKFENNFPKTEDRLKIYSFLIDKSTESVGYLKILNTVSKKYLKIAPEGDLDVYEKLFNYHLKRGDFKEAELILRELIKKNSPLDKVASLEANLCFVDSITLNNLLFGYLSDKDFLISQREFLFPLVKNYLKRGIKNLEQSKIQETLISVLNFLILVLKEEPENETAAKLLDDALKLSSSLSGEWDILQKKDFSVLLLKMGKIEEAAQFLETILWEKPELSSLIAQELVEFLEANPEREFVTIHYLLAKCYYNIGNLSKAVEEIELAYNLNIKNKKVLKFYLQVLIKANLKSKILLLFKELTSLDDDPFYKSVLFQLYVLIKDSVRAKDLLLELMESQKYMLVLYPLYFKLLSLLFQTGHHQEAVSLIEQYGQKDESFLSLSISFLQKHSEIEMYRKLLQDLSNLPLKNSPAELGELEARIKPDSPNIPLIVSLAIKYVENRELTKANSLLVKFLEFGKQNLDFLKLFWEINLKLGNFPVLIKYFKLNSKVSSEKELLLRIEILEQFIFASPFLFEAYNILKDYYLKLSQIDKTIDLLEKLLLLNPRDNINSMLLRKLYLKRKKGEKKQSEIS